MDRLPSPTNPHQPVDQEQQRWSRIYAGEEYFYGEEPGPVARRAVRYHAPWLRPGSSTALDAGCGEGQDLVFLAERGYHATGLEFTTTGAEKSRQLVASRGFSATVLHQDLRNLAGAPPATYDLVLAVNSVQFLGGDASGVLDELMRRTAPGGVMGLSLFAREGCMPEVGGTVWFTTLEELVQRFQHWQCLETAKLWQWDVRSNRPQGFVTLIARNAPPAAGVFHLG